ncbi:hypothetical protein BCON_0346g00130 [Botryotinia convoluta]|uniref:Uncharacterized protein n=1 Tax=Botryotinia convoluta TaxID=54673 RepID=A0A4Z1HMD7_9HELO|nr:hypothetical protein BCON_0346g00130 [Botryotinia convoluta]
MYSKTPGHTIVQSSEATVDVAAEAESLVGVGAADAKPMAAMKTIVEALKNIVMLRNCIGMFDVDDVDIEI